MMYYMPIVAAMYGLSGYLENVMAWSNALETLEQGLSLNVLGEIVRGTTWIYPSWQPVYDILKDEKAK
jgi:hypothetical protein